jgi:hypothetical protein
MPTKTKIPQLPVATTISNSDNYILQQSGVTKRVSHETLLNAIEDLPIQSLTYAELSTLITNSDLVIGERILVTNATTANIPLIVDAIAVNLIGVISQKTDDPDNYYLYDFANNVLRGKVGKETLLIGTSVPVGDPAFSKFEIQYNQIPGFADTILYLNDQSIYVKAYNVGAGEPRLSVIKSRGTINTPLPIQSGDTVGGIHIEASGSQGNTGCLIIRTTATSPEESGFFPSQSVFYGRKKGGSLATLGDEFMRVNEELLLSVQGAFRSARLTTLQRDALVGLIGGEQIFNTDTNKHQGYNGSTWNDMY